MYLIVKLMIFCKSNFFCDLKLELYSVSLNTSTVSNVYGVTSGKINHAERASLHAPCCRYNPDWPLTSNDLACPCCSRTLKQHGLFFSCLYVHCWTLPLFPCLSHFVSDVVTVSLCSLFLHFPLPSIILTRSHWLAWSHALCWVVCTSVESIFSPSAPWFLIHNCSMAVNIGVCGRPNVHAWWT